MHDDQAAEQLRRLQSADGQQILAEATSMLADGSEDLQVITRLRRRGDSGLAGAALQIATLRTRAVHKFGTDAMAMYFTRDALEQASRAEVSVHRAARVAATGIDNIVDAGAGIGGDAIAFARAGITVTAIESDDQVFAALEANVRALNLVGQVSTMRADLVEILDECGPGGAAFFDPARRADGRRIFNPELSSPPLSYLLSCADRGIDVIAKMSPSVPTSAVPDGWEAEWVSTGTEQGRSLVEACLWSPRMATAVRRATVLPSGETLTGPADGELPVGPIGTYIYEPDAAVIRAQLLAELTSTHGVRLLDRRSAYLTGDVLLRTSLVSTYEVIDSFAWSKRATTAALRLLEPRDLVIKKRGVPIEPMSLRKEMLATIGRRGGEQITLLIYPVGGGTDVAITRALPQSAM